jgi:hypothetical protein
MTMDPHVPPFVPSPPVGGGDVLPLARRNPAPSHR